MPQSNLQLPEWLAGVDPRALAGIDPALFERVRVAYESPGRFYHTWPHILACLVEFRLMNFDQPRAVLLASLLHDAVYVAGRKDNETQSAEFADHMLAEFAIGSESERSTIKQMILFTASHHANSTPSEDAKKLLDIDLSILGADEEAYRNYAVGVRREFCPTVVSEFKFCIGRLAFLRSVQEQTSIYLTEEMRSRREKTARENIAREIVELEREVGWLGRLVAKIA